MEEAIKDFNKQFDFVPEIVNTDSLKPFKYVVLAGMGGSHLSAGLLKIYEPGIELYVHRDYGLPPYSEDFLKNSLLIASSYSGNTEEVIDFMTEGCSRGLNVVAVSTGGTIIDFAKTNNLPYIQMPNTSLQPRSALVYSLLAVSKFLNDEGLMADIYALKDKINPTEYQKSGEDLAKTLKGKIPIIYSSLANLAIAYNWKIKFNETGKTPAHYNVFSELNHNELAGFDTNNQDIKNILSIIILKDPNDHSQIQKRMQATEALCEERGISVTSLVLEGTIVFDKIFRSLILADWTALYLAKDQDLDPEKVEIIESLKKQII